MFKVKNKNCFTPILTALVMLVMLPAVSFARYGGGGGGWGGGRGGGGYGGHGGGGFSGHASSGGHESDGHAFSGGNHGAMSFERGGSFGRWNSPSFAAHNGENWAFRSGDGHRFNEGTFSAGRSFSSRGDFRAFDNHRGFFGDRDQFRHRHTFVFIDAFGFWPYWYDYGWYDGYGYYPYGYAYPYPYYGSTNNYYNYNYYGQNTPNYTQPQQQQTNSAEAEKYFDDGVKAFGNNDFKTAVAKFAITNRAASNDKALQFAYSQAFLAIGDYKSAAQVLRAAVAKIKPVEEGVFYPRGLYSNDDVLVKHITDLGMAANHNQQDTDMQLLLGYQYLGIGELDRAAEPLQNASLDSMNGPAAKTLLELVGKLQAEKIKVPPIPKAETPPKVETPPATDTPAKTQTGTLNM